jgi:hypothetical protein
MHAWGHWSICCKRFFRDYCNDSFSFFSGDSNLLFSVSSPYHRLAGNKSQWPHKPAPVTAHEIAWRHELVAKVSPEDIAKKIKFVTSLTTNRKKIKLVTYNRWRSKTFSPSPYALWVQSNFNRGNKNNMKGWVFLYGITYCLQHPLCKSHLDWNISYRWSKQHYYE